MSFQVFKAINIQFKKMSLNDISQLLKTTGKNFVKDKKSLINWGMFIYFDFK